MKKKTKPSPQKSEFVQTLEYLVENRIEIRERALAGDETCQNLMAMYGVYRLQPEPATEKLLIQFAQAYQQQVANVCP